MTTVFNKLRDSFAPAVSEKAVEAGKKFLVDHKPYFADVGNFTGVSAEGALQTTIGGGCHAGIGRKTKPYRHLIATENGFSRSVRNGSDVSIIEPFLRWFLTDSPYAPFIYNRDDYEFCRDYGFLVSGETPHQLLQNIMIITRHFYEVYPRAFTTFAKMVEQGYDPFLCYMVCFNSTWSGAYDIDPASANAASYGGHRVSNLFTRQDFENYKKGVIKIDLSKSYIDKASITGGSKAWRSISPSHDGMWLPFRDDADFRGLVEKARNPNAEEKTYAPPNPFKVAAGGWKDPYAGQYITYQELFDIFVPYIQKEVFDRGK